ncbi:rho GTPase-activating protein 11A-like isoform X2 [Rhineura floridana]|uniref:rho GTPase-activating protein 11A-like isoform X2 n=1 Tax=Rhineura floridana TaxID=261503 RepID=UPI002AC80A3E|nr:rho GTPase-activating protein 11A-like isoform X2 [Rhineura floridana]
MPSAEKGVSSCAIIQYLTSIGIHVRHWKTNPSQENSLVPLPVSGGLFGVPLHLLPISEHVEGVPQFLVDACELLRPHLHVEGLFRKCGSMTRIKALKTRLEAGERCLVMALPCDVATLVKQFLRDLPEPLIPAGLQGPLCRVQQGGGGGGEDDDGQAQLTLLLTCLLPQRSTDLLRYFFSFLWDVAARSAQNKMDLANLAVIFAPNLFPDEVCSQLSGRAEVQLRRQAAVVQALISHASQIGTVPELLWEKVQAAFSDVESERRSPPGPEGAREKALEGRRRRRRCSVGNIVMEALSKFRTGRALSAVPSQEVREDSTSTTTLKASFNSKRKASNDVAWAAEVSAKKRRSSLDSANTDPLEDAGHPFDQSVDMGSLQAPASPAPVFLAETSNRFLDTRPPLGSPRTPVAKVQRKRTSCRKHPQRKHSVCTSPCCSPVPFERKEMGRKSLRIFSRNSKDLQPLPASAKAAEPNGWPLMKKVVTDALEGPTSSQQRWARLQTYKLKGSETGSPSQSSKENACSPSCANPEASLVVVKCKDGPQPSSSLDGVTPGHQELDLGALSGSREPLGENEALARESRQPAPLPRHDRTLRRSVSWPEELSGRDVIEEKEIDSSPDEAAVSLGECQAQVFGLAEPPQPGVEVIVAGMRQLGISAVCVTQADSRAAGCPEDGPRGTSKCPLSSKPDLSDSCVAPASHLCHLDEAPRAGLKCLTLHFQRSSPQPNKGTEVAKLSLPKRKGGRRFGRSVSHESGLPLQGGQETVAGQAGQVATRGVLAKSPLQSFKAYGRQIFITRKHIMMSFAGLRVKRELPSHQNSGLLSADSPNPHQSTC